MYLNSILSQSLGCFTNDSILIPYSDFYIQPLGTSVMMRDIGSSYEIGLFCMMFYFSCFSMGIFIYHMIQYLFQNDSDVLCDMRAMMDEISGLSCDEKQEMSEKYYILTNLLVNRFRIQVYEKILK